MKALDLSFDAPNVTPGWCAARQGEGFRLLIGNGWTGNQQIPGTEDALRMWREAGGLTGVYVVVHDGRLSGEHLSHAQAAAGAEWPLLAFCAVDVELEPCSVSTVRAACALVTAAGQRPIIYTARYIWTQLFGDTNPCADYPLWDASYGVTPALNDPDYGGWDKRTGHQYQNTTVMDGIAVDLSVFDDAWVLNQPVVTDRQRLQNAYDVVSGWSRTAAQMTHELADVAADLRKLLE